MVVAGGAAAARCWLPRAMRTPRPWVLLRGELARRGERRKCSQTTRPRPPGRACEGERATLSKSRRREPSTVLSPAARWLPRAMRTPRAWVLLRGELARRGDRRTSSRTTRPRPPGRACEAGKGRRSLSRGGAGCHRPSLGAGTRRGRARAPTPGPYPVIDAHFEVRALASRSGVRTRVRH